MTTGLRPSPGPGDVHHCCSGCKGDVHCTHGYETWWTGYDRGVRNATEFQKAAPPAPLDDCAALRASLDPERPEAVEAWAAALRQVMAPSVRDAGYQPWAHRAAALLRARAKAERP
jgi:hypothetical protein